MLNMYKCIRKVYIDDKLIENFTICEGRKMSENPPENVTYHINWDTLGDGLYIKELIGVPNRISRFCGKKVIITDDTSLFCPTIYKFKEGKDELNIRIEKIWKQYSPSMGELFKWYDGDQAIHYLKDRGLSVCPVANKK